MVKVMTSEENREIIQRNVPEALLSAYEEETGPSQEELKADTTTNAANVQLSLRSML